MPKIMEIIEKETHGKKSANSIRLIFSVFRNSLRRAYNLGYAEKYIGDKLTLPKVPETEVVVFTESEQTQIANEIAKMLQKRSLRHKLNGICMKIIDRPKTYSSRRVIPLPSCLMALLAEMKKESKLNFVISDKNGNTVRVMDDKTLSEVLGHRSPVITLKLYVHSLLDHKRRMMGR